jgi:UDP-3-O-acyl N-acetylglucosamine deacetylase
MVEHIMAALAGMGIDNCQVWVDRAEMPGCDGSSLPLVEALAGAGLKPLPAWRSILDIRRKTKVGDASSWIEAVPWADGLRLTYHLDYPGHPAIGQQTIDLVITQESFVKELAPARTFLLVEEAEWLRAQGLGGRVTPSELLVFDQHGPVQNELRFADECVRHKALDVVGDLGLVPFDIRGHITAYRSGHALNAQLARRLLQEGDIVAPQRRAA